MLLSLGIDYGEETEDLLAAVGEDPARERASALVFLVAQLLFIPSVYGVGFVGFFLGPLLLALGVWRTKLVGG